MEYKQGSPVPRTLSDGRPYMVDLYKRSGAEDGSDPQLVLDSAENAWNSANGIGDRVGAVELLMGRRVDGGEVDSLPRELVNAIFEAHPFDIAVDGVVKAIEAEQPDSQL